MKSLDEIVKYAKVKQNKTIALACPEDLEVLTSVIMARKENLCDFILFGCEEKIISLFKELNEEIDSKVKIVNTVDNLESCTQAVKAVHDSKADVLMKGLIDTSIILKEVLNKEYGLRSENILSHVMICQLEKYNRLLFLSDGGLNIDPNPNDLKQITENAVNLAHLLGIEIPKVALLSAVEKVNPKIASTLKCQAVIEMYNSGLITGCMLAGPLALDLALDQNAAKIKNITHPVAGNADILITPYIEVANVLYKGWMFGANNTKSAGIIVGAKAPIVLTSRSDSHESKLYSIALSVSI